MIAAEIIKAIPKRFTLGDHNRYFIHKYVINAGNNKTGNCREAIEKARLAAEDDANEDGSESDS